MVRWVGARKGLVFFPRLDTDSLPDGRATAPLDDVPV